MNEDSYYAQSIYPSPEGVTHKVHKGETLWRIAKTYDVRIEDIIRANRITDVSKIEIGDEILIPGATEVQSITLQEEDPNKDEFAWPVRGEVVKSFGNRSSGQYGKGISIKAEAGELVRASRQGKVVYADYLPGFALTVIVDHEDGFHSVYSNNDRLETKLGEFVYKGEPLARVGKMGRRPFLYFEIRKNGRADNPLFYLPKI